MAFRVRHLQKEFGARIDRTDLPQLRAHVEGFLRFEETATDLSPLWKFHLLFYG
ncbi:MAG: hypothetical protein Satyrvirus22_6 [Satyrvirus sp.]|uniref:Uncharacterized protein n=1 Tax=Satyrvirus sp. TaxID=2487771 RepID=A0A3G5AEC6_9VIRU|nr:MAG: hypothetical protein Satyrvirus22_6 [Satyrvirus sp.]